LVEPKAEEEDRFRNHDAVVILMRRDLDLKGVLVPTELLQAGYRLRSFRRRRRSRPRNRPDREARFLGAEREGFPGDRRAPVLARDTSNSDPKRVDEL
jgi:hypothetical protein